MPLNFKLSSRKWLLFALLSWFSASSAYSCYCGAVGQLSLEEYNNLDVLFIGTISDVVDTSGHWMAVFQVDTAIKGDTNKQILVYSGRSGAACGLYFKPGQKWIIYANIYTQGIIEASYCSRSMLIKSDSAEQSLTKEAIKYSQLPDGLIQTSDSNAVSKKVARHKFLCKSKGRIQNNKPHGIWEYKLYEPDGLVVTYYAQYDEGKKVGTWKYFDNTDRICLQINYRNNILHGNWTEYNEDGTILYTETYVDGVEVNQD
ncbi:MAG: hypothetical protein EP332_13180 [Bacteroidetes bacterium]|nr:MAG: hypothetical protein EP332_13180 [Bacteroidota bacterium]